MQEFFKKIFRNFYSRARNQLNAMCARNGKFPALGGCARVRSDDASKLALITPLQSTPNRCPSDIC